MSAVVHAQRPDAPLPLARLAWTPNVQVAAVYYLSAWIGHAFAIPPSGAAPLWPPAGVALAALLMSGLRVWPGVLVGALAAQTSMFADPARLGPSLVTSVLAALGSTAQAWLGAWALRAWVGGTNPLQRSGDTFRFALVAYVGCTIGATFSTIGLAATGVIAPTQVVSTWTTWWSGDALGVLVVSPLALTWPALRPRALDRRDARDAAVFLAAFVILSANLLGDPLGLGIDRYPLGVLLLPMGLWAIHRWSVAGMTVLAPLVALILMAGTVHGHGPFAGRSPHESILLAQIFAGGAIVTGFVIASSNLQHRVAEQQARSSEERVRAVVAAVPDVLVLLDADGRRVGLHSDARGALDDRDVVIGAVRRALSTRSPQALDYSTAPGRWWAARAVPLFDGPSPQVLWVARDVTAEKELEANLRQREKMSAIGQLAGGIAHDFNNLLAIINGNASLLLEGAPRPELAEILDAGLRGAALTGQLLDFSRRDVVQATIVDVNAAVASMARLLRRTLGDGLTLELDLAPDLPGVFADQGQLEQVVLNVVVNARDAIGPRGRIAVRTRHAAGRVVLEISDDGRGMTPEVRARIFEPFFTTKGIGRGTGLGLSTVYAIVTRWGGDVDVDSAPGAGSTFRFRWPPRGAVPPPRDATPAPAPARALRVLVVEDEAMVRRMAVRSLTRLGHDVLEAGSAAEAAVVIDAAGPFDALLSDVLLPDASGPQVGARFRERHPAARIVYMSGYADHHLGEQGVLTEGVVFLQKPFSVADLAKALGDGTGALTPA